MKINNKINNKMVIQKIGNSLLYKNYKWWHEFDRGCHKRECEDLHLADTLEEAVTETRLYMAAICKHNSNYQCCDKNNHSGKKTKRSCKSGKTVNWPTEVR